VHILGLQAVNMQMAPRLIHKKGFFHSAAVLECRRRRPRLGPGNRICRPFMEISMGVGPGGEFCRRMKCAEWRDNGEPSHVPSL